MKMLLLLPLLACKELPPEVAVQDDRPAPVQVERAQSPADTPAVAPQVDAPDAPASVASIRPLLQARHDEDVPGRDALDQHPDAPEALMWMAQHDELMLVRARALDRLGLWDTDAHAAHLLAVVSDAEQHPKLRSAAMIGLGHTDLEAREEVRTALLAQATGDQPRLAAEAVLVLADSPSARPELEALAAQQGLAPEVVTALASALK